MTVFGRLIGAAALVAAAACASAPGPPPFQARTAFARLDSLALVDSSDLRPLDLAERRDALMLQMLAHLDSSYGGALPRVPTRIRRADGYATLAHPVVGILIDAGEIGAAVDTLRGQKDLAGVPRREIEERLEHVVQFLVAHEYAHLLQYALLPPDSVNSRGATRVIECAADMMAGAMHRLFATRRFGEGRSLDAALAATAHFGWVIGDDEWLDGTSHPVREDRSRCIEAGQRAAVGDARALVNWSLAQARTITSVSSVVGDDRRVAVTRDSATVAWVADLLALAARGRAALDELRGPALPDGAYIMRRSLPAPWRCTLTEEETWSAATCAVTLVSTSARAEYERLALAVAEAARSGGWQRDTTVMISPAARSQFAEYALTRDSVERSRLRLELSDLPGAMMAQRMPESRVLLAITVR